MIIPNKNILIFLGIIVLASISFLVIAQKIPRLISHATYYCQSTIVSLLTPIPNQLLLLPFIFILLFTLFALGKLLLMMVKAHILKKNLMISIKVDRSFTKLLVKHNLEDKTYLITSNKPFAFCLGVIRPKIYVSTALLELVDLKELEAILHHEQYHLKNRDTFTMLVASLSATFLPFFPILSDFLTTYRIEREIQADKEAMRRTGNSSLLVSVLKKLLNNASASPALVSGIIEHDSLEPRIAALTNSNGSQGKRFKIGNLLISLFFVFVIVFAIVGPVHAMHMHSEDTHIIMLHPSADECLAWGESLSVHPK